MKPIDPAGFEALFRIDADPWNYASSSFEAAKRRVLLRACGDRCRGRVLELACANGETTRALIGGALRLLAIDGSPTAIAEARRRLPEATGATFRTALLPAEMPRGAFDLVVVSELLYYLNPNALRVLLTRIAAATAPGGRVVLLHHLETFADASRPPPLVHAEARARFRPLFRTALREKHGRYEVLAFDRRRPARSTG